MPLETFPLRLTPWISGAGSVLSTRSLTTPSWATSWPPSSRFSAHAASSRGRPNLRQRSRNLRNQLLNPSAKVSKSLTCNEAPASAPTGPGVVLGTSSSNSTATAPQASLIAALGWRITLAGSRFLTSAEQCYAAIEGEALAVAWGLKQTRYFTQGCDDLVVVTDHKPLVKIFGDRMLDEISNSHLFRLKQRNPPMALSSCTPPRHKQPRR